MEAHVSPRLRRAAVALPVLRRLHRGVAIVVALQLVLWALGGTVFAWLDSGDVAGEGLVNAPSRPTLAESREFALADPREWLTPQAGHELREVRLEPLLGRWVYRVETARGVLLHDARDGSPVSIDAATARALAVARYAGSGSVAEVEHHDGPTPETRAHGAAWAVRFDDDAGTTLWLSVADGRLLETRTDAWRLFDTFWMLHTMDYTGRDDFNHPLVILAGSAALWVALTGVLLAVRAALRGRARR